MIFIPILTFILIWTIFLSIKERRGWNIRECFLYSLIIVGLLIVLFTEMLSLAHIIYFRYLSLVWIATAVICGIILYYIYFLKGHSIVPLYVLLNDVKKRYINVKQDIRLNFSVFEKILLLLLSIILFLIFIIAIVAPPNTWDSMTYHMPRVMHWIQNHTILNYPTNIVRQLDYPPWAEYAIMNIQLLSGSDRFASLVQFFSMLGALLAISLIASHLGAGMLTQIIAVIIAVTVPMGILQSSSTQNDYVVSFWLLCFIYFITKASTYFRWEYVIMSSVSLGLCILTKGTGCIYALPFLIWFIFKRISKCISWKYYYKINLPQVNISCLFGGFGVFILMLFIISAINIGYWYRNIDLHGTILPPSESQQAVNKHITMNSFITNIIKNVGMHLRIPYFKRFNSFIESGIQNVIKNLEGSDIAAERFSFTGSLFHEDNATNFFHVIIYTFCIILFFLTRQYKDRKLREYFFLILCAFILFNLFLKWRPYQSRYQLPLFIMFSPFVAVVINKISEKAAVSLAFILLITAMPWVFMNQSRPLLGKRSIFMVPRIEQYFANRPSLKEPYIEKCGYLQSIGCYSIGIHTGPDTWEYPLWIIMMQNHTGNIHIEHIYVNNDSNQYISKLTPFIPQAIIDFNLSNANKINFRGGKFIRTRLINKVNIFVLDKDGSLTRKNLVYQIKKRREIARQIAGMPSLTKEDFRNKVIARKEELRAARLVDQEELAKIDPELAAHFKNDLLRGLEIRMTGYVTSDTRCLIYGESLIKKWEMWINSNRRKYSWLF